MPGEHARLSPSAAERWLTCPASIRMQDRLLRSGEAKDDSSTYAQEGTAAHALGELKARLAFGQVDDDGYRSGLQKWREDNSAYQDVYDEMVRHTDAYVELLKERMALYDFSELMLEQRLDTGVPQSWGTSDAVIFSPVHVEIVDFKYGQGVEVEAEGNPQLRLYALGALDTYGDILGDTELVRMTVHQPRLNHVLTAEMTPQELRAWRDEVIPLANLALSEDAPFGPSEQACRWCPASGRCRAQLEKAVQDDFGSDPETLTPEEMADVLGRLPEIKIWLNAFEEAALETAYSQGQEIPGYKVVRSGGKRVIDDGDRAITHLTRNGFAFDQVAKRSLRGIGELEKLLGAPKFRALLVEEGFVRKTDGRESLVHESDKRPAISKVGEAAKEFSDEVD